jgi:hypothetical protein
MEEFIVILIQLFFEFGIQFFASPLTDFSLGNKTDKGCGILCLHMLLGGGLGWLSTLIAPKLLLPLAGLRIANLIVSPLLAGGIAWFAAKQWTRQDAQSAFLHGALFALMFGMARYACGTHG